MSFMKLDILAFGAHPDDIELGCGGMLISEIGKGRRVGLVDLTYGELGSRGTVEIRKEEAQLAAGKMGAVMRINLGMPDGRFEINDINRASIIDLIRKHQPEIVLANAPYDRHPDHGRASLLVEESAFLAGLIKWQQSGVEAQAWRPKAIYKYMQFVHFKPDFVYDISHTVDQKMETIRAHASQFWNPDSEEPATLIASREFFNSITARSAEFGLQGGFEHGEPFQVIRTPGVKDIFDLS
jgi:bacillithiol biosynthesis deacetylase BshB1